jgi:hypothetical protein
MSTTNEAPRNIVVAKPAKATERHNCPNGVSGGCGVYADGVLFCVSVVSALLDKFESVAGTSR